MTVFSVQIDQPLLCWNPLLDLLSIQNDTFIFSFTDPCFVGVSYDQKRLDLVLLDECIPLCSIAWLHFIVSMETV